MSHRSPWVDDRNAALLTDQYQLTMLQAYHREELVEDAVFSLFVRRLPPRRNFLLACGLDDALRYLETLRFDRDSLDYLASRDEFSREFVDWLADLRFTGDVHALPEGTPVFAEEPILEVTAPLPEAQLVETFLMNQIHFQTLVATKAARVVHAARGRTVVDFGLRRTHGTDAGVKAVRAYYIAGLAATSNVLAGRVYGVPVSGTMAHSYIQAHGSELEAFRAFSELYPDSVLLVDTYDTLEGVRNVTALAAELGDAFRVRAIRLDSGDLAELAFASREMLDEAGLEDVEIFASGGLDEYEIARLVEAGAPITGFGVGTGLGVSKDAPSLDIAYKLTAYAGRGRLKLSPDKRIIPGRKQVFRVEEKGLAIRDVIGLSGERDLGRPLLRKVMEAGARTPEGLMDLEKARKLAQVELARLPDRLLALDAADPPYPVRMSAKLEAYRTKVASEVTEP
ncbi:MAG: nicotinate phosphoribosyltransferase [Gemmatimonadota bacterium]